MAVQAFSLIGYLEAQTAQFEARMAAAGNVVNRLASEKVVATRAAGQMRVALQGLAQQAIGVTGPLGQLSSSVIGLFGGAAGLAAVGAAGGIALAIREIGRAAEAEAIRINKLDESINKLLRERGPSVGLAGDRQAALETLAAKERELEDAAAAHGRVDRFGEMVDNTKVMGDLAHEIGKMNVELGLVGKKFVDAQMEVAAAAIDKIIAAIPMPGFNPNGVPLGGPGTTDIRRVGAGFERMTPEEMLAHLAGSPEEQQKRRNEEQEENIKRLTQAGNHLNNEWEQMQRNLDQTRLRAQMLQVALVNAVAGGLAMLVSGGSPGGFLMGAGGAISLFNPVAGAIVSGIGGIVSAAESKRDRHTEEQTAQIVEATRERPPVIIREHNLSDSGMEHDYASRNNYIGRGGRVALPRIPRGATLSRP